MNLYMFTIAFKHYFRRITRDKLGILIFTVIPIVITAILSYIYTNNTDESVIVNGYNMITTHISIGMLLLFQLNGGLYVLHYLNNDFVKDMKWRLKSTPAPTHILAFAALASCAVFMIIQGILVVGFTSLFMEAYWGNYIVTMVVIILVAIFSVLLNVMIFFLVKKVSLTETLSWVSAWLMAALGGLMFDLPQNTFFLFMREYGSPFALGQTAIKASGFLAPSTSDIIIGIVGLVVIIAVLGLIVIRLGRRKMA